MLGELPDKARDLEAWGALAPGRKEASRSGRPTVPRSSWNII
jgi:hypothetical protein